MRRWSFISVTDWNDFVANTDPNVLAMQRRAVAGGFYLVNLSEATWELAKLTGKFIILPDPWDPASRLSAEALAILGAPAADAMTVGTVLRDFCGKNIFTN